MIIHDISLTTTPEIVTWDGHEQGYSLSWSSRIGPDCAANVSIITDGTHTGTHVDAPLHFVESGGTLEDLDLTVLVGPVHIVEVYGKHSVTDTDLDQAQIPKGTERILLKTDNTRRGLLKTREFHRDYCGVAPSGATWLVKNGVKLIGIDYLSIGPYGDSNVETHQTLLGAAVIILETLVLDQVNAGAYTLVALPPKFAGAEGGPCRVILIEGGI